MSENVRFSPNQLAFIEWLATPTAARDPKTMTEFAEMLGVNPRTLTRWRKQPEIKSAVTGRARELLGEDLPEIYAALRQQAISGSFQHIKLVLEVTGEYTESKNLNISGGLLIELDNGNDSTDPE